MSPAYSFPAYRLGQAVRTIRAGGILAYPTEAVYGLGCNPLNETAVRRLLALKRRPEGKGLILIADRYEPLLDFIRPLEPALMKPVLASWPGPHTWLLPVQSWVPRWIRGDHDSIAVRVTAHPLAGALCKATAMPLVSTSANISRRQPVRSPWQLHLQFGNAIELLPGPLGGQTAPTPIRDARNGKILRI